MATFTANKGYGEPTVNGDNNVWGTELNSNWSILDNNLGGKASINCAGNSNVTLSAAQAQCMLLVLTGALTGNIDLIAPAVGSFYVINNECTGAYTLTVITSAVGSTGVVVPNGTTMLVATGGTQVFSASNAYGLLAAANIWAALQTFTLPPQMPTYTVAGLPVVSGTNTGQVAYATNARNTGQGAAAGTGALVAVDNTGAWAIVGTGLAPTA